MKGANFFRLLGMSMLVGGLVTSCLPMVWITPQPSPPEVSLLEPYGDYYWSDEMGTVVITNSPQMISLIGDVYPDVDIESVKASVNGGVVQDAKSFSSFWRFDLEVTSGRYSVEVTASNSQGIVGSSTFTFDVLFNRAIFSAFSPTNRINIIGAGTNVDISGTLGNFEATPSVDVRVNGWCFKSLDTDAGGNFSMTIPYSNLNLPVGGSNRIDVQAWDIKGAGEVKTIFVVVQ